MISPEKFKNPDIRYRPKKMDHFLGDTNVEAALDAVITQGYGGVVTNPPYGSSVTAPNVALDRSSEAAKACDATSHDGIFTANRESLRRFSEMLDAIEKRGLGFWIYDEVGYPSGQAGGLALDGHPEFLAKGMFMYKRFTLEPVRAKYRLPDEADKIVYAAKYSFGDKFAKGRVDYTAAVPVEFSDGYVECDLNSHEALFVFSVMTAHHGTPGMHNNFSQNYNINIMDGNAVRRFIDTAYEPIAAAVPDAYSRAENVFTDEPSLFTQYVAADETWNYALAPFVDGIFEEYSAEYGERLEPSLPLIFEGGEKSYTVRIKFYELVGKLIARAYSGQLAEWCEAHGCGFSGHYLGEGNINHNVSFYGNYLRVLMAASYPGADILRCVPERYQFLNERVPQMAVRKKKTDGMMMEICPFAFANEFERSPYDNMKCITALCYRAGARQSHSYFTVPADSPDSGKMRDYNDYTARLYSILDGLKNDTDLFVYYPIEDAQAKYRPLHSSGWNGGDQSTKEAIEALTDALEFGGYDYYLADFEDVRDAEGASFGDYPVKTLIVPKVDTMRKSTLDGLTRLANAGVDVIFTDGLPRIDAESGGALDTSGFEAVSVASAISLLELDRTFIGGEGKKLIRAKFKDGEHTVHMLVNMERSDVDVELMSESGASVFDPDSGEITRFGNGDIITVSNLRAVFAII